VSGELDRRQGGRPELLFGDSPSRRRTIYGEIDRQFFPTALRVFDVANPDIHVPQRSETTVPQQALFYLNHPLVQDRARELARLAATIPSAEERVTWLFRNILQREPIDRELDDAVALITEPIVSLPEQNVRQMDWSYLFGSLDAKAGTLSDVKPIPYFAGTAWQGSEKYPDDSLGWIQLTATGGHPGNDHQHVCIRRWTAPRSMTIEIKSVLTHEPGPGDGIHAFMIDSEQGLIAEQRIHKQSLAMNSSELNVQENETIDFVVDIGEGLNSDQFLWNITIHEQNADDGAVAWNSESDFTGPVLNPLTSWEQLAQVLLCGNEFLFVD